jgi:hypothetical protein
LPEFAEFGKNSPILANKVINDIPENVCQYCHKTYARKYEVKRHHKICKVKIESEKSQKITEMFNDYKKETEDYKKETDEKIDALKSDMSKAIVQKTAGSVTNTNSINHSNNNNNTTNNILLSFKDTDMSHMKIKDWEKIMMRCCMSVPACVKKLHFDPLKPENKNIYKSNLKDKYLKCYEEDKWNVVDQEDKIDKIYTNYSGLLEEMADKWEEDKVKHSTRAVLKLRRFLEKQEEPNVYNNILKELIMIFYNNR